jgi:hypothetical protein
MNLGKATLAWKLISAASHLCLDLGLHRQPPGRHDPISARERILFWFVYAMDRSLALNFGRTSNIQDYDLTIEFPTESDTPGGFPLGYYGDWFHFAQVQGDIYQQLFSVAAQRESPSVRAQRAQILASRVSTIRERFIDANPTGNMPATQVREAELSIEFVFYSTLTLIHRVVPPPDGTHPLQYCDDCIITARKALNILAEAWRQFEPQDEDAWRLFINWSVLFVPFIPFTVIFGNTIACQSRDDLELLQTATRAFRTISHVAPAMVKLRATCEKFCAIASTYLAQQSAITEQRQQDGEVTVTHSIDDTHTSATGVNEELHSSGLLAYQAMSDFPMQDGGWDAVLNEWDLGLGAESAREMTGWFQQYMDNSGFAANIG